MRLELHRVKVKGLQWTDGRSGLKDGVLLVNRAELVELLSGDERLARVDVDLARPGESVRIAPVKDVVEPRCKISGGGEVFPGFVGDVETVGSGQTLVLDGAAVVTCGRIVGFQEGIIDMTGPGAEYTPFSRTFNVVLIFEPVEGIERHEYEAACRLAGLKAAHFLARASLGVEADEVEVFDLPGFGELLAEAPRGLPKVAYLYMLQSQGLLHDTWVYGVDAKRILPTIIHPNEVMDGAIVSGNCVSACDKNTTYHHQNNPVIRELYRRHGKELVFVGVVITNENVTLADKKRSSSYAAKLLHLLGVDGAIITEEGFGNPDTDLIMNCVKAERLGIKTVLITDEYAGRDGASQSLADAAREANAVVTAGNANALIELPRLERFIGYPEYLDVIAGGFAGSLREDGSVLVELQAITGATNELGFSRIGAYTI